MVLIFLGVVTWITHGRRRRSSLAKYNLVSLSRHIPRPPTFGLLSSLTGQGEFRDPAPGNICTGCIRNLTKETSLSTLLRVIYFTNRRPRDFDTVNRFSRFCGYLHTYALQEHPDSLQTFSVVSYGHTSINQASRMCDSILTKRLYGMSCDNDLSKVPRVLVKICVSIRF